MNIIVIIISEQARKLVIIVYQSISLSLSVCLSVWLSLSLPIMTSGRLVNLVGTRTGRPMYAVTKSRDTANVSYARMSPSASESLEFSCVGAK